MPNKLNHVSGPSLTLDHAQTLVARILEFVVLDQGRFERFLKGTGFRPEEARDLAQSPLFMLSVLDTTLKDDELREGLQDHEAIGPELIELTQASLVFHVTAELTGLEEDKAQSMIG